MEKKKYFAIIKGWETGVLHDTWSNVEKYVSKFNGNKFKSFDTFDEASSYYSNQIKIENSNDSIEVSDDKENIKTNNNDLKDSIEVNNDVKDEIKNMSEKDVIAFTDGSYTPQLPQYGSAAIIITKDNENQPLYKPGTEYLSMRNVAGEIFAVKLVIEWVLQGNYNDVNYNNLHIYYDYKEIGLWADGIDTAKNDLTRSFVEFVAKAREKINITFSKVHAHDGVKYNEIVDKLAKDARDGHRFLKKNIKDPNIKIEIDRDLMYSMNYFDHPAVLTKDQAIDHIEDAMIRKMSRGHRDDYYRLQKYIDKLKVYPNNPKVMLVHKD